ncbi:MAG: 3-dehydroquinate dehydratase [Alphaproteobacteria bacterium MarineAlpha11_Bin1]|nr:MAG: 3-dehydroquinate dehydratase [Alphaproteobacteria bacterium MarineAlpha11_Bin1]|tara:strand:+ start:249 stop:659 length:411 start_codon:yes stop_codon:yes gene_type:complete
MLGNREPAIYGNTSLDEIRADCETHASGIGAAVDFRQSNNEAEMIDWIQAAPESADGIIINPAAFTHTSIAILDALVLTEIPVIEIHISNIFRRESFRQHSYVSMGATGIISGFGASGYIMAIDALVNLLAAKKEF